MLITAQLTVFSMVVFSQRASVNVDNVSGSSSVSLPLYKLQSGSISLPVSLVYSTNGVKVKEVEGSGGLGWNLQAGGAIYRHLRGLPDESLKDFMGNPRLGWLNNTNGAKISAFSILNDNSQGTCSDENSDIAYINSNFSDLSDTEPDLFIVNAPGLNCKLVFDADHHIRTIPYMDIKVDYELTTEVSNPSPVGSIKKFVITTTSGTKYTFSSLEIETKQTLSSNPLNIVFFKREYQQFNKGIDYVKAWHLSSIKDIGGNGFNFIYSGTGRVAASDNVALSQGMSTTVSYPFNISRWSNVQQLERITYGAFDDTADQQDIKFYYRPASTTGIPLVDSISGMGNKYFFNCSDVRLNNTDRQYRALLTSVMQNGNIIASMDYNGVSVNHDLINLPDSASKAIDVWGYYNGSAASSLLPTVYINPSDAVYEHYRNIAGGSAATYSYNITGESRNINFSAMNSGTLSRINYVEDGGSTSFEYEPNDYFDQTAAQVIQGGGLRVKKLTSTDGNGNTNNVVTNYSYIDPQTGISSGRAVEVPVLSFTTPYLGTGTAESIVKNSVIRLEKNISQDDSGILYKNVKVSRTGGGSSHYEYTLPATNWDNSWGTDWSPTLAYFSRPNCVSGGYMRTEKNAYPFAPNANYDFERGLLKKLGQYDESGNKIRESIFTYQRTGAPLVIGALRFEENGSGLSYAKYNIFSSVGNLKVRQEDTVFDPIAGSQANLMATDFAYTSAYHKELTSQTQVKSDGSIATTYFKYLRDYLPQPSADPMVQSMYNMVQKGMNLPIESYNQVKRNGINRTFSGMLTGFKSWAFPSLPSLDLPVDQFSFANPVGLTDFQPSGINGGVFLKDSRYRKTEKVLDYDKSANVTTVIANGVSRKGVVTDPLISAPVAVFENAGVSEIAFENFEGHLLETGFTFNSIPGIEKFALPGRFGGKGFSLAASDILSRTINKLDGRKTYVFSAWMKTSASGNLNIALNGAASYAMPYNNTGGDWKYFQIRIPVTNTGASFTLSFQGTASAMIDDVLFYPADATVSTIGYDPNSFLKTSVTNTNGKAEYYSYDERQRLKNVMDGDHNITVRKSYVSKVDQDSYSVLIYHSAQPTPNNPVNFSDAGIEKNNRKGEVRYTWNFGDGSAPVSISGNSGNVAHTYTAPGNYNVTLTKYHELYGTLTDTKTVAIAYPTTDVKVYITNPMTVTFYQGGVLKYFFDSNSSNINLPQGTYDIKIIAPGEYSSNNPSGYKSVQYVGYITPSSGQIYGCYPSKSRNFNYYFYGVNLTGKERIIFSTKNYECTGAE